MCSTGIGIIGEAKDLICPGLFAQDYTSENDCPRNFNLVSSATVNVWETHGPGIMSTIGAEKLSDADEKIGKKEKIFIFYYRKHLTPWRIQYIYIYIYNCLQVTRDSSSTTISAHSDILTNFVIRSFNIAKMN